MLEVLASTGLPGLRIKLPNLFATFRIERNHAVRRSREVQHAINHERSGFKWGDVVPVGFIGAAIHFSHVRSEEHTSESSHVSISYAVFCLKKKIKNIG